MPQPSPTTPFVSQRSSLVDLRVGTVDAAAAGAAVQNPSLAAISAPRPAQSPVDAGQTYYVPLAGLAWLHFVSDGAANFLPGVLPAVLVAVDRPPALAGALMFVLVAGQALQPVAGLFHRALGSHRLIWLGAVGTTIGLGLVGATRSLPWLLAVLALIGVASACFHPQALATARIYAGRRGHFGVALMLLGGEIGAGVWPLIAGAVVAWGSLASLWLLALAVLATLPFVHRCLPPPPVAMTGAWRVRLRGRAGASARLLAYVTLRGLVVIGTMAYLPILWKERGGDLIGGAALVTTMVIAGMAGLLYGSHVADRVGRRRVLSAAAPLMALGLALIASGSPLVLWLGAAITGVAAFATYAVTTLAGQDLFPENRQFGSGIAFGLGNALGAGLAAIIGLAAYAWPVSGLFWLLAGVALLTGPLGLLARARPRSGRISRDLA